MISRMMFVVWNTDTVSHCPYSTAFCRITLQFRDKAWYLPYLFLFNSCYNRHTTSEEDSSFISKPGIKADRDFKIQQRFSASHLAQHLCGVAEQIAILTLNTDTLEVITQQKSSLLCIESTV